MQYVVVQYYSVQQKTLLCSRVEKNISSCSTVEYIAVENFFMKYSAGSEV